MSVVKTKKEKYSSEKIHDVARKAWNYMHDDLDWSLSKRNLGQLEQYGDMLAEEIDNTDRPQPKTDFIEDEMPEKPSWKASVHVMLDVLSEEYGVIDNYQRGSQYSRWAIDDTDSDEIKEITEILDGFTDSL